MNVNCRAIKQTLSAPTSVRHLYNIITYTRNKDIFINRAPNEKVFFFENIMCNGMSLYGVTTISFRFTKKKKKKTNVKMFVLTCYFKTNDLKV